MPGIGISLSPFIGRRFNWAAWWASCCDTWHTEYVDYHVEVLNLTINERTNVDYKYTEDWIIEAQRNNFAVAIKDGYLWYSEDNSLSFIRGVVTPATVKSAFIFNTGTALFATQNKIYRSADKLQSYTEKTVNDLAGNPINITNPGQYYRTFCPNNPVIIDGIEHFMFGNYTNLIVNSEVNIYHTYDDGQIITMIYQFGVNANYSGYGDPLNPIGCRHVHAVDYNRNINKWLIQTGDSGATPPYNDECHWIEVKWNGGLDYSFDYIKTGDENSYFKVCGFYWDDDNYAYWASDSSIHFGIIGVDYDDIGDIGEYNQTVAFSQQLSGIIMENDGEGIAGVFSFNTAPIELKITKDFWAHSTLIDGTQLDLLAATDNIYKYWPKNSDGYFLAKVHFGSDFGGGGASEKTLLIKIK